MTSDAPVAWPAAASTDEPVVDVAHVDVTYTVRGADRLTVRDVSFQIGQQESFGLVGESGCGKTTMALAIDRYLARNGRVSKGSITVAGQDVRGAGQGRAARAAGADDLHGVPGAGPGAQPVHPGRPPGGGGLRDRRPEQVGGGRPGRGVAAHGADQRSRAGAAGLPPPALRRHAPAGRHRDGPRFGARAAHPGRADDRPGRHRRGGDPRAGVPSAGGVPHLGAVHQPQPRGDREDVRPGRRDVRGRAGGAGPGARGLRAAPAPVHGGAAAVHPAPGPAQGPRPPGHDPGLPARPRRGAGRLHLRPAVRASPRSAASGKRRRCTR